MVLFDGQSSQAFGTLELATTQSRMPDAPVVPNDMLATAYQPLQCLSSAPPCVCPSSPVQEMEGEKGVMDASRWTGVDAHHQPAA